MSDDQSFTNWQEAYEAQGQQAINHFRQMSDTDVLAIVNAGGSDFTFSVFDAIAERGKAIFARPLFEMIKREDYYLNRWHATTALFKVMGWPIDDDDSFLASVRIRGDADLETFAELERRLTAEHL